MFLLLPRGHRFLRQLIFGITFHLALFGNAAGQEHGQSQGTTQPIAKGETVTALDNAIWHVFQASNKDYWFGSNEQGAYRYDGKTLVRYTAKDGLPANPIRGFQEDEAGNIYIASDGISRFDGKSFTTLSVSADSDPANWALGKKDLWFAGPSNSGSAYRFDGESLHLLKFPATAAGDKHYQEVPRSLFPNANYSPYDVYVIFRDSGGNVWFGSALLGACRFDGKTFAWIGDEDLRNGSFGTRSVVEDKDGKFWFSNALHRYSVDLKDPASPGFIKETGLRRPNDPERLPFGGIMSGIQDTAGDLWIATYGEGVWRYDGTNLTQYPVLDGGKPIHLYTISIDREGTLWLGTQTSGAWRFTGTTFERFQPVK